jgi:uncharacterized iron-regulated membrane protein
MGGDLMPRVRTVLFWMHLSCGVAAGIVILLMSVTGVLLTYQRQMQWWADTRHYHASPPDDDGSGRRSVPHVGSLTRLPAAAIVDAARQTDPDAEVASITLRSEPDSPAAVAVGTRTIYVNPYTAHAYGEGTGAGLRAFFSEVVVWHRYLAMSGDSRPTGKAVTGAANLLFLFIVLSGIYLWWPRIWTWTQLRNVLWFRRGVTSKARDFNWHHVLGFWSALPLALVVYSGVVISYPWATNMVYRAAGEEPPAPARGRGAGPGGRGTAAAAPSARDGGRGARASTSGGGAAPVAGVPGLAWPVDLDAALAAAAAYEPDWRILSLRVPADIDTPVAVTVDRGDGGQPHLRGTLTLDAATLRVQSVDGFSTQTPGRRARSFLRFAHTGEVGGLAGQTIAGLVSAAGAVLVYTGLALTLRRFLAWRRRG